MIRRTRKQWQSRKSKPFILRFDEFSHLYRQDRNFRSFNELHKLIPDLLDIIGEEGLMGSKVRAVYREVNSSQGNWVARTKLTYVRSCRRVRMLPEARIAIGSSVLLLIGSTTGRWTLRIHSWNVLTGVTGVFKMTQPDGCCVQFHWTGMTKSG